MHKGNHIFNPFWWPFLFLVLAVAPYTGTAQTPPVVTWSPKWEEPRADQVLELFGHAPDHFYALIQERTRRQSPLHLYRMDTDSMHVQAYTKSDFPRIDQMVPSFHRSLSFAHNSYLISTSIDESNEEVQFHAWAIDSSLSELNNPQLLGKMPQGVIGRTTNFRMVASPDDKYLAVIMPQEVDPSRNDKFQIQLFDADLNLIHKKSLEVPHPFGEVQYGDLVVDSAKAIYMIMHRPAEASKGVDKVQNPGRDYYLLRYDWAENTIAEKALSIGVKWIYEARMGLNQSRHLHIAGYYSDMIDLVMAGTFSVSFDLDSGALVNSGLQAFDRNFKVAFRLTSGDERTDLALFEPDHVFPYHDSSLLLLSEKREVVNSTMFNPATGTYFTIQNFVNDEILVSSISETGAATRHIKIPKYQTSSRSLAPYLSYIALQINGVAYIIFNDHERNAPLDIHSGGRYNVLSGPSQAQAVLYSIGPAGELYKYILFNKSPNDGILNATAHYPVHDGVILLISGAQSLEFVRLQLAAAE